MLVLTSSGRWQLEAREGSPSDTDVIRETWVENVYRIHASDFEVVDRRGVFLDIGANIGAVSTFASDMGAYVVAVEPDPDNLRLLAANMKPAIVPYRIVECAVGATPGEAKLTPAHGNSKITPDGPVTVEMRTLEQVMALTGFDTVDVCKIDIEGSEYPVIESTPIEVLERIRYLTMEFDAASDTRFGRMVAKLAHSFAVTTLGSPERGGYIYARRYEQ